MTRLKLAIKGRVQGVGFRPFIYKLANKLSLTGFIRNDHIGVEIQIQGNKKNINSFEFSLKENLPPLAKIDHIKIKQIESIDEEEFKIIQSDLRAPKIKIASIPPDIAICDKCKLDINNTSKYKKYFATNCTDCGPRYSIIETIPYDRINTSMKKFDLCDSCRDEYNNPLNRRYHAQPISCNTCGPKIHLWHNNIKLNLLDNEIFKKVSTFIKDGKIGAIKGIGGFHLICDASNDESLKKLREFKNRPTKPFALMCKDINMTQSIAYISQSEKEILTSKEAPVVILRKKKNNIISNLISLNINKIGCMLPYTALHHLLFEYLQNPIVATSANLNSQTIIADKKDIETKLPFCEFILDFNRDIVNTVDDSVVQIIDNKISTIRLARGFSPKETILPYKINKNILAIGANSKNTISLAFDNKIITSPYIGNLNNIQSFEFFLKTIKTFQKFYDFIPDIIICDKHPQYETTKWAKKQDIDIFEVQHHIAHIYSVKAEFGLDKDYLGFSFDGTGYGDDGNLWGGEVFIGDKRKYSFKQIKLLGGERAIKEPRRVALSMLFEKYNLDEIINLDLELIKTFKESELKLLFKSWQNSINTPLSSSVGRLFDGVASLANICHFQSYEGESGLLCEKYYDKNCKNSFEYTINDGEIDIDFDFLDKQIITKFINTISDIIIDITKIENKEVILSGGVFQNKTLLELVTKKLTKNKIKHYYNQSIPINDGGISLGQLYFYLRH